MATIAMVTLWPAIAALVALAAYRQVRTHVELRNTLRDLGQTHDLLLAKLAAAGEALANADAQEEPPSEERAPGGHISLRIVSPHFQYGDSFFAGAQALLLKELRMAHEQLAEEHWTVPERYAWVSGYAGCGKTAFPRAIVHQGQCIRSSDDLVRGWQEEEDYRALIRLAEAEPV